MNRSREPIDILLGLLYSPARSLDAAELRLSSAAYDALTHAYIAYGTIPIVSNDGRLWGVPFARNPRAEGFSAIVTGSQNGVRVEVQLRVGETPGTHLQDDGMYRALAFHRNEDGTASVVPPWYPDIVLDPAVLPLVEGLVRINTTTSGRSYLVFQCANGSATYRMHATNNRIYGTLLPETARLTQIQVRVPRGPTRYFDASEADESEFTAPEQDELAWTSEHPADVEHRRQLSEIDQIIAEAQEK